MKWLRWAVLLIGFALVGGALLPVVRPWVETILTPDAAFEMPVAVGAGPGGVFTERRSESFQIVQPARYEFTPAAATAEFATKHAGVHNFRPRTWYSYAPDEQEGAPLVILLHGASRDGLSMIEMWRAVAEAQGIALIAPNSAGPTWPVGDPDPAYLAKLVDEMSALYAIDPDRIYLFGHSDGATYAETLLNKSIGPWRAAAMHAGFAHPNQLIRAADPKPFRLYLGEFDDTFPLDAARAFGAQMAKMGHDNDLIVIPSHNHWFYTAGPQIAQDAWRWFLSLG